MPPSMIMFKLMYVLIFQMASMTGKHNRPPSINKKKLIIINNIIIERPRQS